MHEPAKKQASELSKTDAKAAATLLEAEIAKCSDPNSTADMFTILGEIYTVDLKDAAKAIEVMDRAFRAQRAPRSPRQQLDHLPRLQSGGLQPHPRQRFSGLHERRGREPGGGVFVVVSWWVVLILYGRRGRRWTSSLVA